MYVQSSYARVITLSSVCKYGTALRNLYLIFIAPLSGQIASLTGGESGNESPLAVEM